MPITVRVSFVAAGTQWLQPLRLLPNPDKSVTIASRIATRFLPRSAPGQLAGTSLFPVNRSQHYRLKEDTRRVSIGEYFGQTGHSVRR